MDKYDYRRAVTNDVKHWIMNDSDLVENDIVEGRDDDIYNWIYDEIFDNSAITGNGAYYYGTEEECSGYLNGNFDLLYLAMDEFAIDNEVNVLISHYEDRDLARYFDCTIRCYLLMDCIYKAVEELRESKAFHCKENTNE